jgi:hypothetical protein
MMNYDASEGIACLTGSQLTSPFLSRVTMPQKRKRGVQRLRIARGADLGVLRKLSAGMGRVEVVLAGGKRIRMARGVEAAVLEALARRVDVVRLELVVPA